MIKQFLILFSVVLSNFVSAQLVHPPNTVPFIQSEVSSIYIDINPSYLNLILTDSLYSDHDFPAKFKFVSSGFSDSLPDVGFRLRGNTSRDSFKKSFKISFNEYVQGRKWQQLEKLNLNGEHNDVSILRTRLSNQLLKFAGIPCSRTSYVKLFINNEYKGLYINVEHIDEQFIKARIPGQPVGDLYKCTYPANMMFNGTSIGNYVGPYEAKTPPAESYSSLINFLDILNNSTTENFPCAIQEVFDVDLYLRTLAMEILIGHWDGYCVNQNNYYLYKRPNDGKFMFIQYDMDNTFGIDWFGVDWTERNIYNWTTSNNRPLYNRLMNVPYFKDRLTYHFRDLLLNIFLPNPLVDELRTTQLLIKDAAFADTYKYGDYQFSNQDFLNAIDFTFGQHVKEGLKSYLEKRADNAIFQLLNYNSLTNPCVANLEELEVETYVPVEFYDLLGRKVDASTEGILLQKDKFGNTKRIWNYEP
ncbi:MAG: hypothetical protein RL264_2631 [Bacteroidota bacterium]|jgi:hypothetical protein